MKEQLREFGSAWLFVALFLSSMALCVVALGLIFFVPLILIVDAINYGFGLITLLIIPAVVLGIAMLALGLVVLERD